jgi:hypothetical protein
MVNISLAFGTRLSYRDYDCGNMASLVSGHAFRKVFLSSYDNKGVWNKEYIPVITLNFQEVVTLSPSFANEAFAYFRKYGSIKQVLGAFRFVNITKMQRAVIEYEIMVGYS